jgi:acetolactate synthase-1/2/3 large subunit
MRVADYIIEFLELAGVEHIFTVAGGGAIFLCDALSTAKKMRYVACHHEQAASMASEAYARVRQSLGVALVTSGPGGTNAVTGTAGCWLDHVPQLTISGQTFLSQTIKNHPGLRTLGVQEINIVDIVRPITKYAVMVEDANDIRFHLEKAVYLATNGRPGPTWIDIPANIQNANIEPGSLKGFDPIDTELSLDPNLKSKVALVVELLKTAKRPLIHVGQGVRIANAIDDFFDLLDTIRVPFVTARNANDIGYSDHDLYAGHPGTYAQRGANFAVQTSDLYLAIGTRLSLAQTGYNAKDYARNAKKIMVDIDQAELDKDTVNLHLKVQTDAKLFLAELTRQLKNEKPDSKRWKQWLEQCQSWRRKYPVALPEYREQKGSINSYHFIDVLSDVLTSDDVVVTDMGFAFQNTHQAFKVKKGQRVFTNCGLASMGWGLPAAVGASFAREMKSTICIAGEGGFMMTSHEMATVMHHRLPIKLFILNNGGYLTIKQTQELGFENRLMGSNEDSGISFPDLMKIAEAHFFKGVRLHSHHNLKQHIEEIIMHDGPVLCEIMMDHDQETAPKAINRRNADGTMKQTPIEDSYPFLDQNEIDENMSIVKNF